MRSSGSRSPVRRTRYRLNFWNLDKTTMFVLAIVFGQIVHYCLFGFLFKETLFKETYGNLSEKLRRRTSLPCSISPPNPDCLKLHASNHSRSPATRRFHIHVFLYRRVDSAALLLHDLTKAEYKVIYFLHLCTSNPSSSNTGSLSPILRLAAPIPLP